MPEPSVIIFTAFKLKAKGRKDNAMIHAASTRGGGGGFLIS